jgi:ribosome recycling factor
LKLELLNDIREHNLTEEKAEELIKGLKNLQKENQESASNLSRKVSKTTKKEEGSSPQPIANKSIETWDDLDNVLQRGRF